LSDNQGGGVKVQDKEVGQEAAVVNQSGRSANRWLMLLVLLLFAALLILGVQTYRSQLQSAAMTTLTENNYQRDFHDLAQHMDEITGQLAQVLSVASREQLSLSLSSLWRQTFAAQANLGGLPLAMVQLNQTEKFLGDTADSVYYLLWRTAREADTLKDTEKEYVMELYNRSQSLSSALEKISYQIVEEDLRLVDLQNGLWQGDEMKDNTIIDGLGMLETELEDYPELNLASDVEELAGSEEDMPGPPYAAGKDLPSQGGDLKGANQGNQAEAGEGTGPELQGNQGVDKDIVAKDIIVNNALDFWLGPQQVGFAGRLAYQSGGDLPTYGVEIYSIRNDEAIANVDVAKKDGKVIWAMSIPDFSQGTEEAAGTETNPDISEENLRVLQNIQGQRSNISVDQGASLCLSFLTERDFPDVALVHSQMDEGFGIYTFAPMQDGICLYPDQIKMQVDLASAQITGYEGTPYYRHHRTRQFPAIKVSRQDVLDLLSPYLTVTDMRLALIENDWNQEVLTWEVRANLGQESFALYYDTEYAIEEKVIRLTPASRHITMS
jgi:spore germination protein